MNSLELKIKKILLLGFLLIGSTKVVGYTITNMANSPYPIKVFVYKKPPAIVGIFGRLAKYELNPGQSASWNWRDIQKKHKNVERLYFIFIVSEKVKGKLAPEAITIAQAYAPIKKGIFVLNAKTKADGIIGGAYYQDKTGKVIYINKIGYQKAFKKLGL